jgi:Holliday junction DNA helicase RuvA
MIYYLSGKITIRESGFIVVDVNGVGYKVFVAKGTEESFKEKSTIFCFMQNSEKDMRLFGFKEKENLEFFERLMKISGIGPKTALQIASIASMEEMKRGIEREDKKIIKKIFSIGEKKGQQVVFELSRKFIKEVKKDDAFETLKTLGFCDAEICAVLEKVSDKKNGEDRVSEALKILGK